MTSSLRVLIVEDEMLVSMLVEDMLKELGHIPVGPANRLEQGIKLAKTQEIDLAVLDVNLAGSLSFPIADVLKSRGIPVIFATGYGTNGLQAKYAAMPLISKPFSVQTFSRAIDAAVR